MTGVYVWLRDRLVHFSENDVYARMAQYRQQQQSEAEQRGR